MKNSIPLSLERIAAAHREQTARLNELLTDIQELMSHIRSFWILQPATQSQPSLFPRKHWEVNGIWAEMSVTYQGYVYWEVKSGTSRLNSKTNNFGPESADTAFKSLSEAVIFTQDLIERDLLDKGIFQ